MGIPRVILGFNSRLVPLVPQTPPYNEAGDTTAAFNTISSFLIKSDLVSDGIPVNSVSSGTIANVLIDVPPGSLINYTPFHPTRVDASELIGRPKNSFNFRLTDQNGVAVNTSGEYWSFTVVLRYYVIAKE